MSRKTFTRSTIAAAVLAALATGYAQFGAFGVTDARATAAPVVTTAAAVPLGGKSATDFSGIVERYGPAVVNIDVTAKAQQVPAVNAPQMSPGDPVHDFFQRFGIPSPYGMQPDQPQFRQGQGSGFIVSPDGLILTNAHVVADADDVTVRLTDRREFKAKVLGVDRQTDVAVIKIDAKDLPVVKLGNPHESHRLPVRLREHRHLGHHQRQVARTARRHLRAVPADRCRGESRQFGWPAVQHQV